MKPIHPFPARMAPELAIRSIAELPNGSLVLDPMSGSGTVIRQAAQMGYSSMGFDVDPLAVLMSRVWTHEVSDQAIVNMESKVLSIAKSCSSEDLTLPWMDGDEETLKFVQYWFGKQQIIDLRKVAFAIHLLDNRIIGEEDSAALDVIKVALSKIIITKEKGASLARDVSHSRPHKVMEKSEFDVFKGFAKAVAQIRKINQASESIRNAKVRLGDSRNLNALSDESVDAIVTSPPYLNAIDYLRGHRLSLVWLGYQVRQVRAIRSGSIGAERAPDKAEYNEIVRPVLKRVGKLEDLPRRYALMINRYAYDIYRVLNESYRVTKKSGLATFVLGDSCLKGVLIKNSETVLAAASIAGFNLKSVSERELPIANRYLPTPETGTLGKRMRKETILTFYKG